MYIVMVYISIYSYAHGGAAIYCDAKYIESHCARYAAENGVVVFSADYRLAPENKARAPHARGNGH